MGQPEPAWAGQFLPGKKSLMKHNTWSLLQSAASKWLPLSYFGVCHCCCGNNITAVTE